MSTMVETIRSSSPRLAEEAEVTRPSKQINAESWIRFCDRSGSMVLILDGNSEIGAHVRSDLCYLIRWRAVTNRIFSSEKNYFHYACATCYELPSNMLPCIIYKYYIMSGYLVIIIYIWRIDEYMWYAVNGIRKQHLVHFFFCGFLYHFAFIFHFFLFLPNNLGLAVHYLE